MSEAPRGRTRLPTNFASEKWSLASLKAEMKGLERKRSGRVRKDMPETACIHNTAGTRRNDAERRRARKRGTVSSPDVEAGTACRIRLNKRGSPAMEGCPEAGAVQVTVGKTHHNIRRLSDGTQGVEDGGKTGEGHEVLHFKRKRQAAPREVWKGNQPIMGHGLATL
ncbi:MAG: hypothetical protein LUC18_02945 [Porphyromonadaceae bacterium]|nr:hypothetical protein [Porphyromonadaceae bacterium]